MPTNTFAGCIEIFENFEIFSKNIILEIEKEINDFQNDFLWHDAPSRFLDETKPKINWLEKNKNSDLSEKILNDFKNGINLVIKSYAEKHLIENLYYDSFILLKYKNSTMYKAHADGETKTGRSVSCIFYLNDEYDGGEIEFVNFDLIIKPKKNMMILFPSNYAYAHKIHEIKSGTRYCLVTWLKDNCL